MNTITIKENNVKGIIKHYEMMLNAATTETQKEFYQEQIKLYNNLLQQDLPGLNENDLKTLNSVLNNKDNWNNKIFKIEIDEQQQHIKVISKRKVMKGYYFSAPLFKELLNISITDLEKYIFAKYTTSIYMYM